MSGHEHDDARQNEGEPELDPHDRNVEHRPTSVQDGQVDKMSGILPDPDIIPGRSGLLGAPGQGGEDLDELNAEKDERRAGDEPSSDPRRVSS